MDEFRSLTALAALALGLWNYFRLKEIDQKTEYKDKHRLAHECLSDAKNILEKVVTQKEMLTTRRENFDLLDSPFIGSYGFTEALKEFNKYLKTLEEQRSKIYCIHEKVNQLMSHRERVSFDGCMDIKNELNEIYIKVVENLAKAEAQVESIERLAKYRAEHA